MRIGRMCPRIPGRISIAEKIACWPLSAENSRCSLPSGAGDAREHFYVGGGAGAGVGHDVEVAQQGYAVGAHVHNAAAFTSAP